MDKNILAFLKLLLEMFDNTLNDEELGSLVSNLAKKVTGGRPYITDGYEEFCLRVLLDKVKHINDEQ